jgi:hypothetical protein
MESGIEGKKSMIISFYLAVRGASIRFFFKSTKGEPGKGKKKEKIGAGYAPYISIIPSISGCSRVVLDVSIYEVSM